VTYLFISGPLEERGVFFMFRLNSPVDSVLSHCFPPISPVQVVLFSFATCFEARVPTEFCAGVRAFRRRLVMEAEAFVARSEALLSVPLPEKFVFVGA